MVAAGPVHEDEICARSVLFVVQPGPVDQSERHFQSLQCPAFVGFSSPGGHAVSDAIIGNEDEVGRQARRLAEVGVTDFNASIFNVRGDESAYNRTYDVLKALAQRM